MQIVTDDLEGFNLLTRIVSGTVGAVLIITILLFNNDFPILLNLIVMLAGTVSVMEIFSAMGITRRYRILVPSILFSMCVPFLGLGVYGNILWYIYSLIMFSMIIFFNNEVSVKDITAAYSMTLLIVISLRFLIELRDLGGGKFGGFYALIALSSAWLTDTGAYFCGSFWGKHKLCEKISPKKTVEGAIGGVVSCIVLLNLVGLLFQKFIFAEGVMVNYWLITVIGVLCSVISIIGDLSFSAIKRGCHIKDFGNVIPGHGGILDRFDSVIFALPLVYFVLKFSHIVW